MAASKKTAAVKDLATALEEGASTVVIQQPKIGTVVLEITGTNGIIQNCFGQKAIEEMLRKHMGHTVTREKKNPRNLLEAAKVKNDAGRICIPPAAIKKAMLTAATLVKGLKKTQLRIQLFVFGQSIPITYTEEVPRMDMVRLQGIGRPPDVRFRPMFTGWKARIALQFSDALSVQTVVDLLNRAGSVGVGEWRPEKDGTFGTFRVTRHVTDPKEIEEVYTECAVGLVTVKIPDWAMDMDIDPAVLQRIASGEGTAEDPSHPAEVETKLGDEAMEAMEEMEAPGE